MEEVIDNAYEHDPCSESKSVILAPKTRSPDLTQLRARSHARARLAPGASYHQSSFPSGSFFRFVFASCDLLFLQTYHIAKLL